MIASRQFSVSSTPTAMNSRMNEIGRRDDRALEQPGRRVDVAGEPREDAARLHVPQLRQRQMQQPVEERAPQRQHDLRVEQALAIVAHARRRTTTAGSPTRNVMPARLRRVRRAAVSSVVLSRTRSMMNRMNSGSIICRPVPISASTKSVATPYRCGHSHRRYSRTYSRRLPPSSAACRRIDRTRRQNLRREAFDRPRRRFDRRAGRRGSPRRSGGRAVVRIAGVACATIGGAAHRSCAGTRVIIRRPVANWPGRKRICRERRRACSER